VTAPEICEGRAVLDEPILVLPLIVFLGVLAQWVAWRVRLPSILLLLLSGILVGPVTGTLDPDALFGELFAPLVSLSVAVILYEGGLSLRLRELKAVGGVVRNLVTVGALATWIGGALCARMLLGLDWALAILLGAILVVTGPTVILPLLRQVRPTGRVGSVLKWEGIVIDPIGALLAVLVFEVVLSGHFREFFPHAGFALLKTVGVGGALGLAGAALLVLFFHRYWIPDYLQNPISLALAMFVYACSNMVQGESGLFAVTLMGLAVANQRFIEVEHIIEFKENIRVLLISSLFILLGARLELEDLAALGWAGVALVAVLIVVVRPLAVLLSTVGSELDGRSRVFLAWMAPRGIVAAAVSSVFALRLEEAGHVQAPVLVSATFAVIIGTVAFYGLAAPLAAGRLGLSVRDPQGLVLAGAGRFGRALARGLEGQGFPVLLVDTNRANVKEARMAGLSCHHGNVLADSFMDDVDLGGMGRLLAMTPNDWVNGEAARRFARTFGKANVYALPLRAEATDPGEAPAHPTGRPLFREGLRARLLETRVQAGWEVKATRLSEEFPYQVFQQRYGEAAVPLLVATESGRLEVVVAGDEKEPGPGQVLISLVPPEAKPVN